MLMAGHFVMSVIVACESESVPPLSPISWSHASPPGWTVLCAGLYQGIGSDLGSFQSVP